MAKRRKAKPAREYGPKVDPNFRGRPRAKVAVMEAVSARLRDVMERFRYRRAKEVGPALGHYTRAAFAERIGVTQDRLYQLLNWQGSAGFSVEILINVCREFGVRPQYLLLGKGPMLEVDELPADGVLVDFGELLADHLVRLLAISMDAVSEGVKIHLPPPRVLLRAVELGVEDAWIEAFNACVDDEVIAAASIRLAVASKVRAERTHPERDRKAFKKRLNLVARTGTPIISPSGPLVVEEPKAAGKRATPRRPKA